MRQAVALVWICVFQGYSKYVCNNTELSVEPFYISGFRARTRPSNVLHSQTAFGISVYVHGADLLGCVELTGSSQHE